MNVVREERDKFLTLMLGHCYHEPCGDTRPYHDCTTQAICKCGRTSDPYREHPTAIVIPRFRQDFNFSSAEGFFQLWKHFKKASWYRECYRCMFESSRDNGCDCYTVDCLEDYIDPDKFADALFMWHTRYR